MPSPVPTPVAAALGLVPTVFDGVRRLPLRAVQLPLFAVSSVLTGLDSARRGYDDLAERGARLLAQLRGTSLDELEDRVEDALDGTPFAAPYDVVEDALEDAAETVTAFVRDPKATVAKAARGTRKTVGKGLEAAAETVEELADRAEGTAEALAEGSVDAVRDAVDGDDDVAAAAAKVAAAAAAVEAAAAKVEQAGGEEAGVEEAPKGRPTPKATEPDSTRVTTAASPEVVEAVERVSAVVGGPVLEHDELPLPDYDHLTLGAVRGRMRSLDLPQLVALRDYERAKANRLPVVTMLDNRIAKLAAGAAQPTGNTPETPSPKASAAAKPPKKVGKTAAARTDSPPHTKVRLT